MWRSMQLSATSGGFCLTPQRYAGCTCARLPRLETVFAQVTKLTKCCRLGSRILLCPIHPGLRMRPVPNFTMEGHRHNIKPSNRSLLYSGTRLQPWKLSREYRISPFELRHVRGHAWDGSLYELAWGVENVDRDVLVRPWWGSGMAVCLCPLRPLYARGRSLRPPKRQRAFC